MKYRIGDVKEILQNKDFEVFVHGCNLGGSFAAGIAGVVRSVYPECYEEYIKAINSGEYEGGQIVPYEVKDDKYCWDSFEDYLVSNPNKELSKKAAEFMQYYFFDNYDDFEQELKKLFPTDWAKYSGTKHKIILNAFTQIHPGPNGSYDLIDKAFATIGKVYDCKISFPLVGAGIAGLNWNVVSEIIDHRLDGKNYECIVRIEDIIKYGLLNC